MIDSNTELFELAEDLEWDVEYRKEELIDAVLYAANEIDRLNKMIRG